MEEEQMKNTIDGISPHAVVAGLGQLRTAGVDDRDGNHSILGAFVLFHLDGVVIDGRRGGQHDMSQIPVAVKGFVSGVILNNYKSKNSLFGK